MSDTTQFLNTYREYRKSKSSDNRPSPSSKEIKKVTRNLFGAAGPSAGIMAEETLRKISESKGQFYGYDFKNGKPYDVSERFVWMKIGESHYQKVRFSTISTSSVNPTLLAVQAPVTSTKQSSRATAKRLRNSEITDYMKPCKKLQVPAKKFRAEEPTNSQPANEQTI